MCVSGLGRPGDLAHSVRALGATVVEERAYGDHHRFTAAEWAAARRAAERAGAWLVVSAKDAARLTGPQREEVRVLEVEWTFLRGEAEATARLTEVP